MYELLIVDWSNAKSRAFSHAVGSGIYSYRHHAIMLIIDKKFTRNTEIGNEAGHRIWVIYCS